MPTREHVNTTNEIQLVTQQDAAKTEKGVTTVNNHHAAAMIQTIKAMLAGAKEITLTETEIFGLILILDQISRELQQGGVT